MQKTVNKKSRCRFDLFVRLRPGYTSAFQLNKVTWCYRGDKFTDDPAKMLKNLLSLMRRKYEHYDLMELYDNDFPADNPNRIIARVYDGVIEVNRLTEYTDLTQGIILPDYLKQ